MDYSVTVIVPAYNEEKFIGKVLEPLSSLDFIDEVLCVNDGSTDDTERIARTFSKVKIVNLPTNSGKSSAVVAGILAAKGDIVVLIDADLLGLSAYALKQMIGPLIQHEYDAVIGYARGIRFNGPLTGERAYFRNDLMAYMQVLRASKGYGLELTLNYLYRSKKTYHVFFDRVVQQPKSAKRGKLVGFRGEYAMFRQLVNAIFAHKQPIAFFYHSYVGCYRIRLPKLFAQSKASYLFGETRLASEKIRKDL